MTTLQLENINHCFGEFHIRDVSFSVKKGSYFMILGNSGAGKSVLLEMIAGLVKPSDGRIILNGKDISNLQIQKRNIGFVFQDQAVFPHLTVSQNIAYPLRIRKQTAAQIHSRTLELAALMNISHLIDRFPERLSGGELQRVALARALATEPQLLLLDEPLTSLDVQLKDELRSLLRKINKLGQTIVHVTHDFEEALYLAGELVFIHKGMIMQSGRPDEVFHNPATEFVARFAGIRNYFKAEIIGEEGGNAVCRVSDNLNLYLAGSCPKGSGHVIIRSEDIRIFHGDHKYSGEHKPISAKVNDVYPVRSGYEIVADCGLQLNIFVKRTESANLPSAGDDISIVVPPAAVKFISH